MRKIKWLAIVVAAVCLAGCAGAQRRQASVVDWEAWGAQYAGLLDQYKKAKEPAELTRIIDELSLLASRTTDAGAREMMVNDLCLISGAAGDAVTLRHYRCQNTVKFGSLVKEE